MKKTTMKISLAFVEWLLRRWSPPVVFMKIGIACLTLAFGSGWVLNVSLPFRNQKIDLNFDSAGGTPGILVWIVAVFGIMLVITGAILLILRHFSEKKYKDRKKVVVIETRGLRDTGGDPLAECVPEKIVGRREQFVIDFRQHLDDGFITDPQSALDRLAPLPIELERLESGLDRRDISYVYGGLSPVPLTFLTGVLLDDEGPITIFDWDRHENTWRSLDGDDDGNRFTVSGLDDIHENVKDVALAVSVSYQVIREDVHQLVNDTPIVQLVLEHGSPSCHWSEDKQMALGEQFLNTVIHISNKGVKRIHLFLAAQNSIVFRFGRVYDKRNLPEVIVYQYQREEIPPYPWGIQMPVAGIGKPNVVHNFARVQSS